jgi:hypothetical protein
VLAIVSGAAINLGWCSASMTYWFPFHWMYTQVVWLVHHMVVPVLVSWETILGFSAMLPKVILNEHETPWGFLLPALNRNWVPQLSLSQFLVVTRLSPDFVEISRDPATWGGFSRATQLLRGSTNVWS